MAGAVVVQSGELADLADRINLRVKCAEDRAKKAVEYAIDAGQLLNEAKALVPHGEWENWLTQHCTVAPRTARAYMMLARRFPVLPDAERQRVADLPMRDAVKAITTDPATPQREPSARQIPGRDERERVVKVFRSAASGANEAAKLIANFTEIKPGKVQSLRNKLAAVIAELDRLTTEGA